jgi:transposase
MVTVGLDVHKRYITGCALDDGGAVLAQHRRLEPSLHALGRWLERGFDVLVAQPYQVKLIWQARTKTDPIDARKLAELARAKLLPAIWIPDPTTRALRQLLRGRVFLVRQRTVMRNRIHAYLTAENLRCPELDLYTKAGQAWLATVELPPVVRGQATMVLANHALLTTQIQTLDRYIKQTVRRDATARRLQTIPGIGPFRRSCSRRRSVRSRASARRRSWPRTRGWCRARGARATRRAMGPLAAGIRS